MARAGWAADIALAELQSLVDEKAKKLAAYRSVVAENWLLVTSDGTKPSQMFQSELKFDPAALKSPFDRTFYYGHPGRLFIEF